MDLFPSLQALVGGVLIGLGAALLLLFNGRAASVSTVMGAMLRGPVGRAGPRMGFLGGIVAAPFLCRLGGVPVPQVVVDAPTLILVIDGLVVGFGSRLGDGSCSGHTVCGLARFARRSFVATAVFFICATAVVLVAGRLPVIAP